MKKFTARTLLLLVIYLIGAQTGATAATFTVLNSADSGVGSLRQAVLDANAAATNDIIVFAAGITNITVASAITVTSNGTLDINGPGANVLTLTATGPTIFSTTAIFALRGVRLTGGSGVGVSPAVFTGGGTTVLEEIVVESYNSGSGQSGAVYFSSAGTNHRIGYSTLSSNTASSECSAIRNDGTLTIVNTTISGNMTTGGSGTGAVCAIGGTTTLRNSTIAGNTSTGSGGFGGGGIFVLGGASANLGNTIVAGNSTNSFGPDIALASVAATFITAGGNLIGTNAGNPAAPNTTAFPAGNPNANGDKVGTNASPIDPLLGPLMNNGGTTPTRAIPLGSPAIDAGIDANAAGLVYDQRVGFSRFTDANGDMIPTVDIGAFEFNFAPTAAPVSVSGRVMSGNRGIPRAVVSVTGSDGVVRTALTNSFGYFRIEGLQVFQSYVIDTRAKGYAFESQFVTLRDDVVDFIISAL